MPDAKLGPIFLDTSIQIARQVHGSKTKAAIKARLEQHALTATGLVARQEYKRRLLKEADYLLRLLAKYESFDEVYQHLIRLPGTWQKMIRKRNICLQTLGQIHGGTDKVRAERLQLYLRSLLVNGLKRFAQSVDSIPADGRCGCATLDVVEKVPLRNYKLGEEHCSRLAAGRCGVVAFLKGRKVECEKILRRFQALPANQKSAEITNAERFLEQMLKKPDQAAKEDPCLKVGDLLLALESVGITNFYTLNSAESQHLCRALDQTLIVRPIDPTQVDVVCAKEDQQWPVFGKPTPPVSTGRTQDGTK